MTPSLTPPNRAPKARSLLSARRIALLATTVCGLGAAVLGLAPRMPSQSGFTALAQHVTQQAQTVQRPVGFADIVGKVKPAVISVRVRMGGEDQSTGLSSNDENPFPKGSPMDRFFRQFGLPDQMNPG